MGSLGQPLRWGLWGSGRVSRQVAQDLALVPGACVAAVGGRRLDAAQQLAAMHPGAVAVDTLAQLIGHHAVDAIYVATPDACHRDDVLAVIAAGKPVLCEKPLTTSLADARILVDAAERRGSFLMEAMWTRFLPAIAEIKRQVAADAVGEIRFMHGSFGYGDLRRSDDVYPSTARAMLYDRGIYLIALAQYLQPGEAIGASAHGLDWTQAGAARALCSFDLQLAGGARLHGVCGNAGEMSNNFDIIGSRGTISIPGPFFKAHRFSLRPFAEAPAAASSKVSSLERNAAVWQARLKRLKRQWQPLSGAVQALRPAVLNFPGNGYQFQFAEVARCVADGRTQSPTMSWDDSLALARALQQISQACEGSHGS